MLGEQKPKFFPHHQYFLNTKVSWFHYASSNFNPNTAIFHFSLKTKIVLGNRPSDPVLLSARNVIFAKHSRRCKNTASTAVVGKVTCQESYEKNTLMRRYLWNWPPIWQMLRRPRDQNNYRWSRTRVLHSALVFTEPRDRQYPINW